MRREATALLALWLIACGGGKAEDPPQRSTRGAFRSHVDQAPAPTPPTPSAEPTEPEPALGPEPLAATPKTPDDEEPKEEPKRDYSAELLESMGAPVDCIKSRAAAEAPRELSVSLEAHVVDLGLVTRAYVASSQLDDQERACLQRRLSAVRFRAPVDGAPRTVSAILTLKLNVAAANTGTGMKAP